MRDYKIFLIKQQIKKIEKMSQNNLRSKFTLWILDDQKKGQQTNQTFEQKLKPAVTFGTVKQFWQFFQFMVKPSKIAETQTDIYIFKEGVRPMWEDPQNAKGGYYALKIQKQKADKFWENAVFALISPLRQVATCINGVRVKIKEDFCILQIWMNGKAHENLPELKQYLKDSLQIYDDRYFFFSSFEYLMKGLKGKQTVPANKQQNKQLPKQQKPQNNKQGWKNGTKQYANPKSKNTK